MNREIKFRGRHVVTGEWVFGFLLAPNIIGVLVENPPHEPAITEFCIVDPKTVGQFTALKDKNGKEIYEGDIIVVRDLHDSNVFDGVWNQQAFNSGKEGAIPQVVKFTDAPYGADMPSDSGYHPGYWEVIGNIYENPDLLPGKETN